MKTYFSRGVAAVVLTMGLLMGLVGTAATAHAEIQQQAVDRAHSVLKRENVGKDILSYVHLGAQYHGHKYIKTMNIRNNPDDFALVYEFQWEDDGVSDVAIICDKTGTPYEVQVTYTNAVLQTPFAFANGAIEAMRNLYIASFSDKLSPREIANLRRELQKYDAEDMLCLDLKKRLP